MRTSTRPISEHDSPTGRMLSAHTHSWIRERRFNIARAVVPNNPPASAMVEDALPTGEVSLTPDPLGFMILPCVALPLLYTATSALSLRLPTMEQEMDSSCVKFNSTRPMSSIVSGVVTDTASVPLASGMKMLFSPLADRRTKEVCTPAAMLDALALPPNVKGVLPRIGPFIRVLLETVSSPAVQQGHCEQALELRSEHDLRSG